MLFRPRQLALTMTVGLCLLTACQPASSPTPSPEPSYRCTPEAGGDEFDCSRTQYDDMIAKDALYAEAEAVYREFFAEDVRILRAGGLKTATPVLERTTAGAFLEDSMDYYRSLRTEKATLEGGEVRLTGLVRAPSASKGGSLVAMRACIDASSARIIIDGRDTGAGRKGSDLLYFGRVDGGLRIQGADGKEGGACE